MTPRQLQAFVAVAQTLSFARASERLHLSQPALSLAIGTLEAELGGRLLSRTTRQVRLTPEGAELLPQALQLLADWDNVRERSRQRFTLQRGHVTIAAMPSFAGNVLPRILRDFRSRFPRVEVSIHDVIHESVIDMVSAGRVELGFGFEPEATNELAFKPLFSDRFMAIVPPTSALANRRKVSWSGLLAHDFIALQRPSTVRRLLEESLASANLQLRVALECHQLATIGQLVAAGLGVSAVPSLCEQQMRALGTRCLRLDRPEVRKSIGLILRQDRQLSISASAVMSAFVESTSGWRKGVGGTPD